MYFRKRDTVYAARLASPNDADAVQRLLARAWRVYLRTPPEKVLHHLRQLGLGWIAGEGEDISGFMQAEILPSLIAIITAAAVSDDWQVSACLDTLLPLAEERVRLKAVSAFSPDWARAVANLAPCRTRVCQPRLGCDL